MRMRSETARRSNGVSVGSSRSIIMSAICWCLRRIVRRVDSVGCAVNTG
jgi:hypothetical protein